MLKFFLPLFKVRLLLNVKLFGCSVWSPEKLNNHLRPWLRGQATNVKERYGTERTGSILYEKKLFHGNDKQVSKTPPAKMFHSELMYLNDHICFLLGGIRNKARILCSLTSLKSTTTFSNVVSRKVNNTLQKTALYCFGLLNPKESLFLWPILPQRNAKYWTLSSYTRISSPLRC